MVIAKAFDKYQQFGDALPHVDIGVAMSTRSLTEYSLMEFTRHVRRSIISNTVIQLNDID